jgi:hypothetical protein
MQAAIQQMKPMTFLPFSSRRWRKIYKRSTGSLPKQLRLDNGIMDWKMTTTRRS